MSKSEFGGITFFVQNFLIRDDKILLVHEKEHTGEGGRRAGWNLFGGNTEGWSIERTYRQIINFLPVEIDHDLNEEFFKRFLNEERMDNDFFSFFWTHPEFRNFMPQIGQLAYLTAVREGIEETGLLTRPRMVLSEERTKSESHRLLVAHSELTMRNIRKRSLETDDCGWFPIGNLPEDIFPSSRRRIALAVYKLGIRDKESGRLLDLFA